MFSNYVVNNNSRNKHTPPGRCHPGIHKKRIVKGAASQKEKDRMLLISLPAEFTTVCFTNIVFFYPFAKNNRTMR